MRLKTSLLLVPLLNPVEVAENIARLYHLCHGRFVLGVAVGYREQQLAAVGLTRKDRAPKLDESLEDHEAPVVWSRSRVPAKDVQHVQRVADAGIRHGLAPT
jgi:alkanesulfonate monooxygenase SsuD/methylene tetrahydromethanopterin reductase-like flavin-dependent oxidoreductase (luciferase family)